MQPAPHAVLLRGRIWCPENQGHMEHYMMENFNEWLYGAFLG